MARELNIKLLVYNIADMLGCWMTSLPSTEQTVESYLLNMLFFLPLHICVAFLCVQMQFFASIKNCVTLCIHSQCNVSIVYHVCCVMACSTNNV